MKTDSLENLSIRVLRSKERIKNLHQSLREEFLVIKNLGEDIYNWEKNNIENQDEGHISGRKCGCGKIHPLRAVPRDD